MPGALASNIPGPVRLERDRLFWLYRQRGWTYEAIARQTTADLLSQGLHLPYPLTSQSVAARLSVIQRRLEEQFLDRAQEQRLQQVAILEHQAMRAFQAFENSCQPEESRLVTENRVSITRDGDVIPLPDLVQRKTKHQSGNPALMAVGLQALADIRKLMGYNAPDEITVENRDDAVRETLAEKLAAMADRVRESVAQEGDPVVDAEVLPEGWAAPPPAAK